MVELARGADLYITETTSPEDVVELFKKNGAWQAKSPSEQEGFLRHIHEEHVTPEDIGKMAAKADVKAVVMTHLGPSIDPSDNYQRYIDEAKKYYSGPITLANDLMSSDGREHQERNPWPLANISYIRTPRLARTFLAAACTAGSHLAQYDLPNNSWPK